MSDAKPKTVLVIGANGYIGNAVARAFVRSGWITYGLVRRESAVPSLEAEEIIPLLGSPADISFLKLLNDKRVVFDAIVSTTEDIINYIPHYKDIITLIRTIAATSNAAGVRPLVLFTSG
jgi:NAD(P)-dependent dehydrogenase (short-subunit alcohol dehydrogenase family)